MSAPVAPRSLPPVLRSLPQIKKQLAAIRMSATMDTNKNQSLIGI